MKNRTFRRYFTENDRHAFRYAEKITSAEPKTFDEMIEDYVANHIAVVAEFEIMQNQTTGT